MLINMSTKTLLRWLQWRLRRDDNEAGTSALIFHNKRASNFDKDAARQEDDNASMKILTVEVLQTTKMNFLHNLSSVPTVISVDGNEIGQQDEQPEANQEIAAEAIYVEALEKALIERKKKVVTEGSLLLFCLYLCLPPEVALPGLGGAQQQMALASTHIAPLCIPHSKVRENHTVHTSNSSIYGTQPAGKGPAEIPTFGTHTEWPSMTGDTSSSYVVQ